MKRKIRAALAWTCACALSLTLSFFSNESTAGASGVKINLNKKKVVLAQGAKVKLKASVAPKKLKAKVTWKSKNKKIASVTKNGVVKGIKKGRTSIIASVKGKKAVCKVTVKKKKSSKKPSATTSPSETLSPTETLAPSETLSPTETLAPTAAPTAAPSGTPSETTAPTETLAPTAAPTETAAPTDAPSQGGGGGGGTGGGQTGQESQKLILGVETMDIDGETNTLYFVNKDFDGTIHLSFAGSEYSASGSAKDALILLHNAIDTRTNSEGTIKIGRGIRDEWWTVEVLATGDKYYIRAETKNNVNPKYGSDCGIIYVKGDVSSIVKIY